MNLVIQYVIKITVLLGCTILSYWALWAVDWQKICVKHSYRQLRVLIMFLALALAYLVTAYIFSISEILNNFVLFH